MQAHNDFIIASNKLKDEQKTASGLSISIANKVAENNGTVISVGPDVKSVKVGDIIWFSKVECQVGEQSRHLIAIKEQNVIAIGDA